MSVQPDAWYVDATFGGGGHAGAILESGGKVLGLDRDEAALARAQLNPELQPYLESKRLRLFQLAFADMYEQVAQLDEPIMGVLMDLGLSSDQLDTPERGLSFLHDGPLDMRMDQSTGRTAADIVNSYSANQLQTVLRTYADEPKARQISQAIVNRRPLETTKELADLVASLYGTDKIRGRHVATQTFQALRMEVNQELQQLQLGLADAWQRLAPEGRLVVISFHSGEDRMVKQFMRYQIQEQGAIELTKKPIRASEEECETNPRARSAILRAIQKKI